ncbi:MAG TPA: malto-oligosyltrehalose trehalohydrolase [Burkholderiales bacterium]|nr:malto-oligosyltrehalose trehalohydrolase [Burkholderiales bacterium]
MPFGAELRADGATRFRLWAPEEARVELELDAAQGPARRAMEALAGGWHELRAQDAPAGTRYRYRLGSGLAVPDPASRLNALDVHGPSEVVDPRAYDWQDAAWRGRPWEEAVIYELHVGAFSPAGTFAAVRARLSELAALGVTALELMPVADFPGRRNWGYDGVLPFAPDAAYGTPHELKALIDAAHALGMMVLLDVVYNHFGPEGNYLHVYCPQFFNPAHHTPWGAAINFDGPHCRTVRDFFIHNALYWIEEYRCDGLRLDAVHAIRDDSQPDIVYELTRAVRQGPARERHVHLVLENDRNEARYLMRGAQRDATFAPRFASAQWNDDLHHALHVLLTGEADGYYADYADAPLERLGRTLAEGFAYQGEPSAFRGGAPRGEPSAQLPPAAFVSFLQTHDQVGNRAFGERIDALAEERYVRAALACVLLAPQVPMLFMGEEYGASTPFLFFCDFGPELAAAVARGRRAEFERFAAFRDAQARARIPDPGDAATFEASRLRWEERDAPGHRERLEWCRALLAQRRQHIVPRLGAARGGGRWALHSGALQVHWELREARLHLLANFGRAEVRVDAVLRGASLYSQGVHAEGAALRLEPAAVRFTLEATA